MAELEADVAVLGAGFGGSLTALLLSRIGLRPVLIDRGRHPRFAIGESSTPVADYVLSDLARNYDLPRLAPLTKYGAWQRSYPGVVCGIKRGFSYFLHRFGSHLEPEPDHGNELLVAASASDEQSDTHWLRADVDAFFAREAEAAGVPYFDQTEVTVTRDVSVWRLAGTRRGEPVAFRAKFAIDATGEAGLLLRTLGIASHAGHLATRSRGLYSHFTGLRPWHELLVSRGADVSEHPFYCDHAALHHLVEEGWMWQLGFNNGVTSAGFAIDCEAYPLEAAPPAEEEWRRLMAGYPALAAQFEAAEIVDPPGRLLRSGRLQRQAAEMVGENWALLPNTAGFIDPLHSTGIAQTLCGIEALVGILLEHWNRPSLVQALLVYEGGLREQFALIDKLVSGCCAARRNMRLFTAFAMLYFAAATTYERMRRVVSPDFGFLCAADPRFRDLVELLWRELRSIVQQGALTEARIAGFERNVAAAIAPYNTVGAVRPGSAEHVPVHDSG